MFHILVADDDRNTRRYMQAVLEAEEYTVFTAENGAEALKACMTVRGDGTIEIPARHGVSIGVYRISLTFTNEGYTRDLDDCFTIIVE